MVCTQHWGGGGGIQAQVSIDLVFSGPLQLLTSQAVLGGELEKSAVAEHAWQDGHTMIDWSDVLILDEAPKNSVLLIKEALHISLRPTKDKINRDLGLDVPPVLGAHHQDSSHSN